MKPGSTEAAVRCTCGVGGATSPLARHHTWCALRGGSSDASRGAPPATLAPSSGQFRKKPVVIEARQLGHDYDQDCEIIRWAGARAAGELYGPNAVAVIPTLEGEHVASTGDWIIRGVYGEFYPCKPDIFAATYEPVTQTTQQGPEVTDKAVQRIQEELDEIEGFIDRGKGTWPEANYVTDDRWARWQGQRSGLQTALRIISAAKESTTPEASSERRDEPRRVVSVMADGLIVVHGDATEDETNRAFTRLWQFITGDLEGLRRSKRQDHVWSSTQNDARCVTCGAERVGQRGYGPCDGATETTGLQSNDGGPA